MSKARFPVTPDPSCFFHSSATVYGCVLIHNSCLLLWVLKKPPDFFLLFRRISSSVVHILWILQQSVATKHFDWTFMDHSSLQVVWSLSVSITGLILWRSVSPIAQRSVIGTKKMSQSCYFWLLDKRGFSWKWSEKDINILIISESLHHHLQR